MDKKNNKNEYLEPNMSIEDAEAAFMEWCGGEKIAILAKKFGLEVKELQSLKKKYKWEERRNEITEETKRKNNSIVSASLSNIVQSIAGMAEIVNKKIKKLAESEFDGIVRTTDGVPVLTEAFIRNPKDVLAVIEAVKTMRQELNLDDVKVDDGHQKAVLTEKQKMDIWSILNAADQVIEAEIVEDPKQLEDNVKK